MDFLLDSSQAADVQIREDVNSEMWTPEDTKLFQKLLNQWAPDSFEIGTLRNCDLL